MSKPIPYRAYFESVNCWGILCENAYQETVDRLQLEGEGRADEYARMFISFPSMAKAKAYLRMHLRGEIEDARRSLREIAALGVK